MVVNAFVMNNFPPIRYLVTFDGNEYPPFLTDYFDAENHFNPALNMKVFDLKAFKYTTNGKDWQPISEDHL